MCAACVAQGVAYAGGAVAGLQVLAARARHRRGATSTGPDAQPVDDGARRPGTAGDVPEHAAAVANVDVS
jgi:hypothetical protein